MIGGIIAQLKEHIIDAYVNPNVLSPAYVQAVIIDAVAGTVIDTLNLIDAGSGYFKKSWITPRDGSGTGLQIKIFVTIYTDSAYTSPAPQYETNLRDYIVRDLLRNTGFTIYRDETDYKKIEKIVKEIINEIKIPKDDDSLVLVKIEEIKESLKKELTNLIKEENYDAVSANSELVKRFENKFKEVLMEIEKRAVDYKKLNLDDLRTEFKKLVMSDDEIYAFIKEFIPEQDKKLKDFIASISASFKEQMDKVNKVINALSVIRNYQEPIESKEKEVKQIKEINNEKADKISNRRLAIYKLLKI
ncbi:MAG: hypothetical protein QMD65_02015 [Patescibacteria group bacterium]|nr:hypothetical protein [Patescibacteria group bacterium]